jgi:dipeptidyl-peptidase-4
MQDGRHYTRLESNKVVKYDLTTGQPAGTILEGYELSGEEGFSGRISSYSFGPDEGQILLQSDVERIYRRSSRANFFVFDLEKNELTRVFPDEKIRYATLSPDGARVAFVFGNNLYVKELRSGEIKQITKDGKPNEIINGATDWVYEEEFALARAFEWSPDSRRIAFLRFDESRVKEFTMTHFRGGLYPEYETFKYPKVGEENSQVSVHLYDLEAGEVKKLDLGREDTEYYPRIRWTQDPERLCVMLMNRHQSKLELVLVDSRAGKSSLLYEETNRYYIEESQLDNIVFLQDGKHFLTTSEKDGFRHLYLYDMEGKSVRQLTEGEWEVTEFYGVDEANGRFYYQAAQNSPLERQIYSGALDGGKIRVEAGEPGWNSAQFSSTFDYYILNHSTIRKPATYTVFNRKGEVERVIEDNESLQKTIEEYQPQPAEFFQFTTPQEVTLNGYMIKPPGFDENKEYPVFMYLYGGPGSQQVVDRFGSSRFWWFQMLAQQGFIVACVDNRGTGGRGEEFKKMTYLQLGHYETIDQIEAAKYLGSLPYADADRIGIFGWSYGGYMSSLCLFKGNDVFKAGIAVAPVTSWKWYDTIYTERYMRTLKENKEGYENNSPVNFAERLKGNYLLIHGMGDDNVHFQQSAEMVNALVDANKQFDTYYYPNRNHGIYGGNTTLHLYTKMTHFLQEKLMRGSRENLGTNNRSRP